MSPTRFYPISLRISGARVLVAGAGIVAARKVARLVECGAQVLVVAPEACDGIRHLAEAGALQWQARQAASTDVVGCTLVFIATDDPDANKALARAAREAGIPANRADAPDECDFLVPAVVQRGAVTVAIDTAGTAPALGKWLRQRVEATLGPEIDTVVDWFAEMRREVLAATPDPLSRATLMRRILDSPATRAAAEGRRDEALAIARRLIAETSP